MHFIVMYMKYEYNEYENSIKKGNILVLVITIKS